MLCCSANWASGWWAARIDCSDEPLSWHTDRKIVREMKRAEEWKGTVLKIDSTERRRRRIERNGGGENRKKV